MNNEITYRTQNNFPYRRVPWSEVSLYKQSQIAGIEFRPIKALSNWTHFITPNPPQNYWFLQIRIYSSLSWHVWQFVDSRDILQIDVIFIDIQIKRENVIKYHYTWPTVFFTLMFSLMLNLIFIFIIRFILLFLIDVKSLSFSYSFSLMLNRYLDVESLSLS